MKATRKRKPEVLPGQLDLFDPDGGQPAIDQTTRQHPSAAITMQPSASESKIRAMTPTVKPAQRRGRPLKIEEPDEKAASPVCASPGTDEWWNSRMVCAFLKISRKTLWERRRMTNLNFPRPAQLGGARNLYRASAIREWAERMANAEY
jgi:predicted DNA-binding transcriptional regulator AlpA